MKTYKKITTGFVIQDYIILDNGQMVCKSQEFIAGDVDYENKDGETIQVDTTKEIYCPFNMVQPTHIPFPPKNNTIKGSYKDGVCPACGHVIPDDVEDGDRCEKCPYIFYEEADDEADDTEGYVDPRYLDDNWDK